MGEHIEPGGARLGKAGQGMARQGPAGQGKAHVETMAYFAVRVRESQINEVNNG